MLLVLSGVGFHGNQSLVDGVFNLFAKFFHRRLMGPHRLQEGGPGPENVLQYVLKEKMKVYIAENKTNSLTLYLALKYYNFRNWEG